VAPAHRAAARRALRRDVLGAEALDRHHRRHSGGAPFRGSDGRLLFRPSGHGALIENLADLDADLVLVKNIDTSRTTVSSATRSPGAACCCWSGAVERSAAALAQKLETGRTRRRDGSACASSRTPSSAAPLAVGPAMARRREAESGRPRPPRDLLAERAAWARASSRARSRLRHGGPNTGEPGGGPMWCAGPASAVTAQIVELSKVNPADPTQAHITRSSTHFNPVFMALALRDSSNRATRSTSSPERSCRGDSLPRR